MATNSQGLGWAASPPGSVSSFRPLWRLIWIGTDRGVIQVLTEKRTYQIGTRSGLLDDKILNMGVDVRGRVWALTEKGISVIEALQAN